MKKSDQKLPPRRFVRMFIPQFAGMVERGEKRQTIRPIPKRLPEPGDLISLRCWMNKPYRSKQRVLREATVISTIPITITEHEVILAGGYLELYKPDEFAKADGFPDMPTLVEWFRTTHGLPFEGVLICW